MINIIKEENSFDKHMICISLKITNQSKRLQSMLTKLTPPQPDAPRLIAQDERIRLEEKNPLSQSNVTVQGTVTFIGKPHH